MSFPFDKDNAPGPIANGGPDQAGQKPKPNLRLIK
jgi:hypothetical protein